MTSYGAERRKSNRIGYDMPIGFSMSVIEFGIPRLANFPGKVCDICDQGLGFLTDFHLEPGLVINVRQADGSSQNAEVRWVGELDGRLRIGVLLYNE